MTVMDAGEDRGEDRPHIQHQGQSKPVTEKENKWCDQPKKVKSPNSSPPFPPSWNNQIQSILLLVKELLGNFKGGLF